MENQSDSNEEALGFYFPPKEPRYANWLDNFVAVLSVNAVYLGISEAEIANLLLDQQALHFSESMITKLKKAYSLYIANRNTLLLGNPKNPALRLVPFPALPEFDKMPEQTNANMRARHVKLVGMLRSNPKMTDDLARLLGIKPMPRKQIVPTKYQPVLSVVLTPMGVPQLKTPLHTFKGYEVWCSKEKENGFVHIGDSVSSVYEDRITTWAGTRYYTVRMLLSNGKPEGLFSEAKGIVVA